MPQVLGTVTEDNGSVVTNYSGTVTNSVQTFTFSTQQDGMTFINKGNALVTLTVNGKSNNVPPNGTIRLNCEFTSFDVTRIQTGSHPFEVNSFRLKNDVRDVEGFVSDNTHQSVNTTFNSNGSITESFASGLTKTTTFNVDGSITEVYTGPINQTKNIIFNADGSISEVVS
jgi:hypothetical protein